MDLSFPCSLPPQSTRILVSGASLLTTEVVRLFASLAPAQLSVHCPQVSHCLLRPNIDTATFTQSQVCALRSQFPAAHITPIDTSITAEFELSGYHLVVLIDYTHEASCWMSGKCRSAGVGLIVAGTFGLGGYLFVDYGKAFQVLDSSGQSASWGYVRDVATSNPCRVALWSEGTQQIQLKTGDVVKLQGVEGPEEVNLLPPMQVRVVAFDTFEVDFDASSLQQYKRGGTVTEVKAPTVVHFTAYCESAKSPLFALTDADKALQPPQLHLLRLAISEFYVRFQRYPHSSSDVSEVISIAVRVNSELGTVGDVDVELLSSFATFAECEVPPISGVIASFVVCEAMKISGRCVPIQQWLYWDWAELTPASHEPLDSQSLRPLFPPPVLERFRNLYPIVIGDASTAYETLRLLSASGLKGRNPITFIPSIDPDKYQKSRTLPLEDWLRAGIPSSEPPSQVCTEAMWANSDCIILSTTHQKDLLLVAKETVWQEKPLIATSAIGHSGVLQVSVPHLTDTALSAQCIACGYSQFAKSFLVLLAQNAIQLVADDFRAKYEVNHVIEYLEGRLPAKSPLIDRAKSDIRALLEKAENISNFEDCVLIARKEFQYSFHDLILLLQSQQSKYLEKSILVDSPYQPFAPIVFDEDEESHIEFLAAAAQANAALFGVDIPADCKEAVRRSRAARTDFSVTPSLPLTDVEATDSEEVESTAKVSLLPRLHPIDVSEKQGLFCDYVHCAVVLRATAGCFPPPDRTHTEVVLRREVSAHPCLPLLLASFSVLEVYKVVARFQRKQYRNYTANLSVPFYLATVPAKPQKSASKAYDPILMCPVESYPEGFTAWDKLTTVSACSARELIARVESDYGFHVDMISCEDAMIYSQHIRGEKYRQRFSMQIHEVYKLIKGEEKLIGRSSIEVRLVGERAETIIETPSIRYLLP